MSTNLVKTPFPNITGDVTEFIEAGQQQKYLCGPFFKGNTSEAVTLGFNLVNSEVNAELLKDLATVRDTGPSVELYARILDHCFDSIYVITWLAKVLDLPLDAYWEKGQEANMAKFPIHEICEGKGCLHGRSYVKEIDGEEANIYEKCVSGRLISRRESDGKIMKPPNWQAPDPFLFLYEYWSKKEQKEIDAQAQLRHTEAKGFQQPWAGEEEKGMIHKMLDRPPAAVVEAIMKQQELAKEAIAELMKLPKKGE
jgi:hypothetical protein